MWLGKKNVPEALNWLYITHLEKWDQQIHSFTGRNCISGVYPSELLLSLFVIIIAVVLQFIICFYLNMFQLQNKEQGRSLQTIPQTHLSRGASWKALWLSWLSRFFPSEIIQTRLHLLTTEEMHQINCIALTFRMSDCHCSVWEGNTSRKNALSVCIVCSHVATPEGTAVPENRIQTSGSLQTRAVAPLISLLFLQGNRKFLAIVSEVHNYQFLCSSNGNVALKLISC